MDDNDIIKEIRQDVAAIRPDVLVPSEIVAKAEAIGHGKANTEFLRLAVLAVMAGLFVGMGGMFLLLIKSDTSLPYFASQILGGLCFCLALFLVVAAGAEQFAGNTLMVVGSLSKKYSWGSLLRTWGIVWVFNFVGSLLLVFLLFFAAYWKADGGAIGVAMVTVSLDKIAQGQASLGPSGWVTILFKGIMCNFLFGLAVWIGYSGRTVVDKLAAIVLPVTAFVACGFEHSVANMFLLPMGWLIKVTGVIDTSAISGINMLSVGGIFYNISAATIGNIIGGAGLVGLSYWLAYRKSQKVKNS
ncbi:MAG: formate/nitrite transporter family protein [Coriobacteriia bacterium]|nr:formate/nitrite transporter family protein [Coriobacteriia bacterium]